MVDIVLTIPDKDISRLEDAFSLTYGYQAVIDEKPNPESKSDFFKRQVIAFIKSVVKSSEANIQAELARQIVLDAPGVDVDVK